MSLQVEKMEKNMAKLTIEVSAEDLDKAMQNAYQKAKGRISIPGFRKGKAPRKMIEQMYGKGVFLEDAANALIPEHYSKALAECDLEIVSQPKIDVTQVEPGKPFIFTAEVATKPEVTLGDYKGLEVPKSETEVTDEEVEAELKKEQEKNSRTITVEDRAAENGDTATIDFEGFVDGEAFEGGKGTDYPLTLGSNTFIPGFEEQLVGAEIGKEVEVNVTFPEDYQAEDLAGKPAVFKVKINEIKGKELPELDDDFAQDISEFDTLAEYKEDVKKHLTERREAQEDNKVENALINALLENTTVDIPQCMIDNEVDGYVRDYEYRLRSQGGSLEMYFQYTGMDEKGLRDSLRPGAERQVKTRLALEAIVKTENITPTDEEIEEEYRKIASGYTVDIEKVKASIPVESLSEDIVLRKAVDLVKENAKITVAVPEEAPKAAKKTRAKKAETADGEEKTEAKPKRTKKAAEPKAEDKAE